MVQVITSDAGQGDRALDEALEERHVFTTPIVSSALFAGLMGSARQYEPLKKMRPR
jgi:hypothetical protein